MQWLASVYPYLSRFANEAASEKQDLKLFAKSILLTLSNLDSFFWFLCVSSGLVQLFLNFERFVYCSTP